MYEIIKQENIILKYVNATFQLADICTKAFSKADDWNRLMGLCQLRSNSKGLTVGQLTTSSAKPRLRGSRGTGRAKKPVIALTLAPCVAALQFVAPAPQRSGLRKQSDFPGLDFLTKAPSRQH